MRLDVHLSKTEPDVLYLDCQAELFRDLTTRVVIPLVEPDAGSGAVTRLNPRFTVADREVLMLTQALVALPIAALGEVVGHLRPERDRVLGAIDLLLTGI